MEEKVVKWANEEAPLFNTAIYLLKYNNYDAYSVVYIMDDDSSAYLGTNYVLVKDKVFRWASIKEEDEIDRMLYN